MAKLSAHGSKLFVANYAASKLAYMSDGTILRNQGDGWKTYKKVKPGVDICLHATNRCAAYTEFLDACPSWARFIKLMAGAAPHAKRHLLLVVIEMMPDDADGVWSHANDDLGLALTCDDCQDLCYCYREGMKERKARTEAKPTQMPIGNPCE
jgi:hypothetical protein